MSILIDNLVSIYGSLGNPPTKRRYDNGVYIAKPCDLMGYCALILRIKDAWKVLIGKAQAYHYFEDEVEED